MNILSQIVESKKKEIEALYGQYELRELREKAEAKQVEAGAKPLFYQRLALVRKDQKPFFIAEFKRKSPSEGWINAQAELPDQIRQYQEAGASAISVLTDEPFFGGTYEDLSLAASLLTDSGPLLLQKDFILDPIQVYLARLYGADIILLIAAILQPEQLDHLRKTAESIGLGVLVEVHDGEELEKIRHLEFLVLGVNNRDLKSFRTALNRVNYLKNQAGDRFLISESGVLDDRHFQMVRNADGFLIGTGLMRASGVRCFAEHFQTQGRYLFKACGIRNPEILRALEIQSGGRPDFIGFNFSPRSHRRADEASCSLLSASEPDSYLRSSAVAVFYQNPVEEIRSVLEKYPFKTVQFYAGEVSTDFIRSLNVRVLMAVKMSPERSWEETSATLIEPYAPDVDAFILDGARPGSGERIKSDIPSDFPYPFLLAGGLEENNLEIIRAYKNCIGVDIASGIETDGAMDLGKIKRIAQRPDVIQKRV